MNKDLQTLQRALQDAQRLSNEYRGQLRQIAVRKDAERAVEAERHFRIWKNVSEILEAVVETWLLHAYNVAPAVVQLAVKARDDSGELTRVIRREAYELAASILIRTGWASTADGEKVLPAE